LLFTADQNGSEKHLIRLLATFEKRNHPNNTTEWYFLFDWANGNLTDFWRENPQLVGDMSHGRWIAIQFHGLAEALQTVHRDRQTTLRQDATHLSLYGRHGDLSSNNILWFTDHQPIQDPLWKNVLSLADFGLGNLHTKHTRSLVNPESLGRTATYRSPEFDITNGRISPRADVFSLGCVYLEHISWYLMGFEAVDEKFPERRAERDIHGIDADTFFRVTDDRREAQLKPQVHDWIEELKAHKKCSWLIFVILELIEKDMLNPDVKKRIRAGDLTSKLEVLKSFCEQHKDFYLQPRTNTPRLGP
jgi:serine/threonine protein kinase